MIDNKDIFEYEGYHFIPVKTIDSSKSFQYFSERIYSDKNWGWPIMILNGSNIRGIMRSFISLQQNQQIFFSAMKMEAFICREETNCSGGVTVHQK